MMIGQFRKFNFDFKILFIVYLFLAFIPIMSEGRYYQIVHFNIIFNKISLAVVFLALLFSGAIRVISKPICRDAMFLFGLGVIMAIFNASMLFFTQDMNFMITGLVLMLAPLIYSLNVIQLKIIITIVLTALIFLSLARILDVSLNTSLNPIVEMRYYLISNGLENIRFQNNSLFGQKNAAGAILSIIFILLLHIETLGLFNRERKWCYFLSSLSFLLLLMTSSAGGIIIGLLGLLFWIIRKNGYSLPFAVVFSLFIFGIVWFFLAQNFESHIARKLLSASIKFDRWSEFFLLVLENPSIFLVGFNAFNDVSFYTESTFADMILSFGVSIPIALVCFIVYMIVKTYFLKQFFLSFIYIAILFHLMTQNSAFLVPSIIIFLIAGGFHKKNIVLQGNASILEESNI